jgi:3-dehydroquinate synthase
MIKIPVTEAHTVVIDRGCVGRLGALLDELEIDRPRSVVTNTTVAPLHGERAAAAVGGEPAIELPDGEAFKRWGEVERLCAGWLDGGLHRGGSVMAVGGGVVTDTVGFAAAVYLRGISWLAVPTTLLAMVDAAVGGKTGVNLEQGKNLVGAFWAPRLVVVDVETLETLPGRELRAGLIEAVKGGWIGDHGMLQLFDHEIAAYSDLSPDRWQEVVARAIRIKAEVVRADERETGLRKSLNLGHTLGHALETATSYERFLHGEAVAWGLRAVLGIAVRRGLLADHNARRLSDVIDRLGPYPPIRDLSADRVLQHITVDKKRDDLGVGWVLPTDDGIALDQRVPADEIRDAFLELQRDSA